MISRIFFDVLLFLLPFALYAAYLRLRQQDEEMSSTQHPWTVLFISGLVLVAASFVFWGLFENANQRGVYIPPHLEDGRLVPGRVVPETESGNRSISGPAETDRVETGGVQ
jgi:uncharacterized protein DUF6111